MFKKLVLMSFGHLATQCWRSSSALGGQVSFRGSNKVVWWL